MSCPDATTIQAAVAGALTAAERAEVETHVDGCDACRRVLAALAPATAQTVADPGGRGRARPPAAPDAPIGAAIGRYQVQRELGAGGMGVVYAAHDPELHRDVAVKLLRLDADAGDDGGVRLQREAQAMAQIAHPNVITVHDVGVWRDQVFVAMELAPDGVTLRRWQRGRALPEVVDAYVEAGRGLAAAHAAGVVHRDFKPDNVVIGADGRPRVTDFGLARAHAGARTPAAARLGTGLTADGVVLGTPDYMAPEQHRGEPADARSDQFAFCVAAWEAVFGVRPFAGTDDAAVLASITAGAIERPRGAPVPAAIERALRRGLAADPALRWPAMAALLDALAAAPRRRRRPAVWIAAGLGLVVAAVAVVIALRPDPAPAPDPRAVQVKAALARAEDLAIDGHVAEARQLAADTVARARAIGSPALTAESLITQAGVHALVRDLAAAEAMLVEAVQLAEGAGADPIKLAAIGQLVRVLDDQGKADDARRWRGMLPATAARGGTDPAARAAALEDEARSLQAQGKLDEALARADAARALRAPLGDAGALATNRMFAAEVLTAAGRLDAAHDLLGAFVATVRATIATHPEAGLALAGATTRLADIELARRDWAAAETAAREAIAGWEAIGLGDAPAIAGAWITLGSATGHRGDRAAATAAFARAIALAGDDASAVAGVHLMTAGVAIDTGDRPTAIAEVTTALRLQRATPGADRGTTAFYQALLGELLVGDGRGADARAQLEPALAGLEPGAAPGDVMVARARFALARALEPDQRARARELAAQARDAFRAAGALQAERLAAVEAWLAGK